MYVYILQENFYLHTGAGWLHEFPFRLGIIDRDEYETWMEILFFLLPTLYHIWKLESLSRNLFMI
jgi:hypothetical protein